MEDDIEFDRYADLREQERVDRTTSEAHKEIDELWYDYNRSR